VNTDSGSTLYRLEEAATRSKLSLTFVRREIARGEIEVVRLGRLLRVSETALAEYLAKRAERGGA
jgi:excisionase family DNA binding protein